MPDGAVERIAERRTLNDALDRCIPQELRESAQGRVFCVARVHFYDAGSSRERKRFEKLSHGVLGSVQA